MVNGYLRLSPVNLIMNTENWSVILNKLPFFIEWRFFSSIFLNDYLWMSILVKLSIKNTTNTIKYTLFGILYFVISFGSS